MRNRFMARGLCLAITVSLGAGLCLPSAVHASDWEYLTEDEQTVTEEPVWDDPGFVWEDPGSGEPDDSDPGGTDTPDPGGGGDAPLLEDPTPTPMPGLWDDDPVVVDPSQEPTGTPEDPLPTPAEVVGDDLFDFVAEVTPTPGLLVSVTPSPTPTATPTPSPTVTPLTAQPVTITTSMVSNLHAGKEFYLNSLKSNYALSFSEEFGKIMDEIEYEYLNEYNLIRPDGTRGLTDAATLKLLQEQAQVSAAQRAAVALMTERTDGLVVLDLDGFTSGEGTRTESSPVVTDVSMPGNTSTVDPNVNLLDAFTSGPEEKFNDLVAPQGLLARNWQDVLAIYVYQQVKLGAREFTLNRSSKQALALIFRELNPITVTAGEASYGNRHVGDYVRDHNIPKWDRVVLKKYTETDCKLLCATVTAAKGFVRQSVGDQVSEERVNVISAAYSLVGKVGYFWGGKSTYIGMDPRWGTAQVVTSEGSGTSGTLRAYGLDCSGFVTWAVINGYKNTALRSYVGDGTTDQWNHARVVNEVYAQPGDFVFQAGPEAGANNHIGILVGKTDAGDWIAVHCSSGQNGVTVGEAYSASFRYIREPSFYPPKSTMVVIGQESLDDIVVPADNEGSILFSDGMHTDLVTEYVNEDFMDIVLFQTGTAGPAQVHDVSVQGLTDAYQDAPATGGLVVLDETGRGDNLTEYLASSVSSPTSMEPGFFDMTDSLVVFDETGAADPLAQGVLFTDETAQVAQPEEMAVPSQTEGLVVLDELGEEVFDEPGALLVEDGGLVEETVQDEPSFFQPVIDSISGASGVDLSQDIQNTVVLDSIGVEETVGWQEPFQEVEEELSFGTEESFDTGSLVVLEEEFSPATETAPVVPVVPEATTGTEVTTGTLVAAPQTVPTVTLDFTGMEGFLEEPQLLQESVSLGEETPSIEQVASVVRLDFTGVEESSSGSAQAVTRTSYPEVVIDMTPLPFQDDQFQVEATQVTGGQVMADSVMAEPVSLVASLPEAAPQVVLEEAGSVTPSAVASVVVLEDYSLTGLPTGAFPTVSPIPFRVAQTTQGESAQTGYDPCDVRSVVVLCQD